MSSTATTAQQVTALSPKGKGMSRRAINSLNLDRNIEEGNIDETQNETSTGGGAAAGFASSSQTTASHLGEPLTIGSKRSISETISTSTSSPSPKRKKKMAPAEKRAARYRSSCPQALRDRMDRALQQRMYLIHKEEVVVMDEGDNNSTNNNRYWIFITLGSTGNVYETCLKSQPTCNCPDFMKRGDLCKHLMFVLIRVVGLDKDDPLAYQKAYLKSELDDLFERVNQRARTDVWANNRVRTKYASMQKGGKQGEGDEEEEDGTTKRRSLEQDCPICLEDLSQCPMSQVTFCKFSCGMNFHVDCMNRWRRAAANGKSTCPNCRAVEPPSHQGDGGGGGGAKKGGVDEGYVNMGRIQGQRTTRDTSTYRKYRYW